MDDDRRLTVPGAKSILIRIAGAWDVRDWFGTVSADEELTGVLLIRSANEVSWTRSRRSGPDGLELRMSVGSDPAVSETWFSADLGGGMLWGRIAGQLDLGFASSPADHTPRTGQVNWFPVCIGGESTLQIGLLALTKTDVRFGRKRIWRLREGLRESLNNQSRVVLVDRRFGQLPNPDTASLGSL